MKMLKLAAGDILRQVSGKWSELPSIQQSYESVIQDCESLAGPPYPYCGDPAVKALAIYTERSIYQLTPARENGNGGFCSPKVKVFSPQPDLTEIRQQSAHIMHAYTEEIEFQVAAVRLAASAAAAHSNGTLGPIIICHNGMHAALGHYYSSVLVDN